MTTFGQPKPLASLSSTLLARKGHARPAMRPQGFGGFGALPGAQDDLGWNDMGHPDDAPMSAPEPIYPVPVGVPPVLRQREALQEEFEAPKDFVPQAIEPEPVLEPEPVAAPAAPVAAPHVVAAAAAPTVPVSLATAARIGRETRAKHAKAAFTLRLDHDRHLRLRLASALHNKSAQHLVTEALDQFLQSLPEVEELARQLPPPAAR
jgi:hypothetical protein